MRAAIYARYSSDLQTDSSIEDQIRIVEERAQREGWTITKQYTDHGISGASMMRPGIQMLMQDAADGKFDVVLAEALDRLSRDQEDIAGIFKRLQFAGVSILTLSEGEISNLHIGLKGTMNAMFLKDLADKTRRGLRGRIEKGKSGGGITYGYDVVKKLDANGEPICGERTINKEQTAIVKRIFSEYSAGKSPLAIAKQLNKESIAGPSGKGWTQSTINGNRKRGTGILNNELYIGRLIWNRLRYIKNPDTGKRVSRPNPKDDWIIKDVPELQIIELELWDKIRERQKCLSSRPNFQDRRRPKLLLSGLLKCGCCGSGYTKISKTHYGCFSAHKKGMCENRKSIRQDTLENNVLGVLRSHLMNPEMCDIFCKEYAEYMKHLRKQQNAQKYRYEKELAKCIRNDDRLIQMVLDGIASTSAMKDRINANSARIEELEILVGNTEETPVLLHPNMAHHYKKEVKALIASLNNQEHRQEAADLIRSLIEKIILTPKEDNSGLYIDLKGDLAGILTMAASRQSKFEQRELVKQMQEISKELLNPSLLESLNLQKSLKSDTGLNKGDSALSQYQLVAGVCDPLDLEDTAKSQYQLVAGVGFEPTTFRL